MTKIYCDSCGTEQELNKNIKATVLKIANKTVEEVSSSDYTTIKSRDLCPNCLGAVVTLLSKHP